MMHEPAAGRTPSNLVRRLADVTDERLVGGKARNLARLVALGVRVPDGVVLTSAAFNRFLDSNAMRDRIDAWCHQIDVNHPESLQSCSEKIAELITNGIMPREIQGLIREFSTRWPSGTLLVGRSSAVGEDGSCASFAGQLDSVLGLATGADVERGIKTCWASYWSARALFYRTARGANLDSMGVIVQKQVDARVSGVLFTRAPSGDPAKGSNDLMIEYCAGLGDALVSGHLEPGRLLVSRSDLSVRRAATLPDAEAEAGVEPFLTPRRILDLSRLALRLENDLGGPQDIEWSIDSDGELWILQARPITVAARHQPTSSRRTVVWSNANVNENFPQPISPLLYSIASAGYYHYFRNLGLAFGVARWRLTAMEQPLRGIIGVHGGRMYYNLTNIHAVLRMAPFGERLAAAFNQFVGAAEITEPSREAVGRKTHRSRLSTVVEVLRIVVCTTWQYLGLRHRLETFERTADTFAARTHPDRLRDLTFLELVDELRAFLTIRNHRWKNASLADAASMVCYSLLQAALKTADYSPTLHNRLLRALPGVPSSIPPVRLWELSRIIRADERLRTLFATGSAPAVLQAIRHDDRFATFRGLFEQFLEEWGFRSSAELMLTVPSLQEDPLPAIELLKQYATTGGEPPAEAIARQAAERRAETSRVLRALLRRSPARAATVWLLIRWTQRAIAYRERARLKQALLYARCRRIALALGDRAVEAGMLRRRDDIFMLSCQEIDELGNGRAMFPYRVHETVDLRLREHALLAAMHPPDTVRLRESEYLPSKAVAEEAPADDTFHGDPNSATLQGIGACGGRTAARAAVLTDVRDARRLERGDVLVTRQTDPGWAPVFCLISGLVIERGGMLSHGAIIAREFGLPCVVGVKKATQRIPHASHVTVDGDLGICTVDSPVATGNHRAGESRGRP
jgi:pyruvate,water dikinase